MKCEKCNADFISNSENHMTLKISPETTMILWICEVCDNRNRNYIKQEIIEK